MFHTSLHSFAILIFQTFTELNLYMYYLCSTEDEMKRANKVRVFLNHYAISLWRWKTPFITALLGLIFTSTLLVACGDEPAPDSKISSAMEIAEKNKQSLFPWVDDKKLALEELKKRGANYSMLSKKLKKDKQIIQVALENDMPFYMLDEKLRKDKAMILMALKYDSSEFRSVDPVFKKDRDVLLASLNDSYDSAVKNLEFAPAALRKDGDFILDAIKIKPKAKSPSIFDYADESLKKDKAFIQKAVQVYGRVLCEAGEIFKKDKELVLLALRQDGMTLECLSEKFRKDKEIVKIAIKQDGAVLLLDIDPEFRNDKELVMTALKQAGPYISAGIGPKLSSDKDIKNLLEELVNKAKAKAQ